MEKPLVIKVKKASVPNGTVGKWEDLSGNIEKFTTDIETPAIDKDTDISAQVSGIPTAYARANLFNSALMSYGKAKESVDQNLNAFYETLSSEWRGFIACIALDYSRLKVMRIYLQYSDGKDLSTTANIYEPKGTFGNMLFHRKPLWCKNPSEEDDQHKNTPFLYIIKYDEKVVGATSPECLLFTSCAYKVDNTESRPWVDYKTGKFKDPLANGDIDLTQTLQLFAYVNYLIEGLNNDGKTGINGLVAYYSEYMPNTIIPKYDNIIANLTEWRKEIEAYAAKKNFKLEAASVPPINLFEAPFDRAFNYKDELYGREGNLYCGERRDANDVPFNPKELLLPDSAKIARLILKGAYKNNPSMLPVYVLAADKKGEAGEKAYFALPMSPKGIKVFGKNIDALVEPMSSHANVPSRLTAVFDPNAEKNNLEVTLHLVQSDGRTKEMKATYTCGGEVMDKDIIVWPNFISKRWHRYFMYSELPHNVNQIDYPFQAVPFVGDELNGFEIINDESGEPLYLAKDGHDVDYDFTDKVGAKRHLETSIHIKSDSATADNPYKYEIYECNHPFKGVRLGLPDGCESGFLLIKYTTAGSPTIPQNKLDIQDSGLKQVSLGVDFGSTNTSIAYCKANERPEGIKFENRRVSLLHAGDGKADDVADEKQLFFFQANTLLSNSIKSTLTLHDSRRVTKDIMEAKDITKYEKEVKGGFPCFSRNLPISQVDKQFIRLQADKCGMVEQAYNMKWDDDERNIAYKKAFLRSLLLQVYAELFSKDLYPKRLKWSYPSSMSESLLGRYSDIWGVLVDVNPLNDVNNHGPVDKDEAFQLEISKFAYHLQTGSAGGQQQQFNQPAMGGNQFLSGGLNSILNNAQPAQSSGVSFGNNAFLGKPTSTVDTSKRPIVLEKDDDTKSITFEPVPLVDKMEYKSMTEACAVANFLNTEINRDDLLICFDIGGSTTDISALCQLSSGGSGVPTMIKQNSIHFAAQLVAFATGNCRNFDKVLLGTCEQFGLRIEGLNLGASRYCKDTAAYYFEQMVDRLDATQLPYFYKKISTESSDLLCVDVYVTGLILYYAGLLTRKLVKQVRNSEECRWSAENGKRPNVRIKFAGKGARIMEWLGTVTDDNLAQQFYQAMFVKGIGQNDVGTFISGLQIDLLKTSDDVKFEVSKGLAMDSSALMCPKNNEPIEIIGEEGFTIEDANQQTVALDADNSITADMMSCLGDKFYGATAAGPRFQDFLEVFLQVTQQYFGMRLNVNELRNILQNMGLITFIKNTPEFKHACNAERFDFVSPILILEGLKFYEDYLLKNMNS